ncbi:MAG: hypothetical protein HFF73_11320 [Oscillospiraceae bacterium]|nr:hypothetical protein [Oscillospiraceae bacterium]
MKANQDKLQRLLSDKKTLEQVAKSPDAQALAGMISQGQDQASLKKIAADAAKGDTSQLSQLIQNIVRSPGGAELLQRLSGTINQK